MVGQFSKSRKARSALRQHTALAVDALEDRAVPAGALPPPLPADVQARMVADLANLAAGPKTPAVPPTDILDPAQAEAFWNHVKAKNSGGRFNPTALVIVNETEPNNTPVTPNPVGIATTADPDGQIIGNIGAGDQDFYSVVLKAGDSLGLAVNRAGALDPIVALFDETGTLVYGNDDDFFSGGLPPESQMPRTVGIRDAYAYATAPRDGTYVFGVSAFGATTGAYTVDVRVRRPVLETAAPGAKQRVFLDFDGATFPASTFGTVGPVTMSPLSTFLPNWGLTATDQNGVIDAIVAQFRARLAAEQTSGANPGTNPRMDFEILNSRDNPDTFGADPTVSRIVIGGTIAELGISTIGIADVIDLGNSSLNDEAVVLLDLLSAASGDPNSLNTIPRAGGRTITDLIGVGVGNIAAHEGGHIFGLQHTDQFDATGNLIDQGGNLGNTLGLGPDGIFGNADDVEVFHVPDAYVNNEGVTGTEENRSRVAWGLTTPAVVANVAPTATLNSAPAVTDATAGPTYDFVVNYADDVALDATSFGVGDVLVTGPNGFSQLATLVSAAPAGNGTPRTVTYRIVPPGGTWNFADNGVYTIAMQANQVFDSVGAPVAPGLLGTFPATLTLVIPDTARPTAVLSSAPDVDDNSNPNLYTLTVTFADDVALNAATFGNGNVVVTGPGGFSQAATFVSAAPAGNGTPRTATYAIVPPRGAWTAFANGTYTVTLLPNQVRDTSANAADAAQLGTFAVALPAGTVPTLPASKVDPGCLPADGQNACFVKRLYAELLGRQAEAFGLKSYTTLLDSGAATRQQVVASILDSQEYLERRVNALYLIVFGRNADPSGLRGYAAAAAQGASFASIAIEMFGSAEFLAGKTPEAVVRAQYVAVLGRGPSAREVADQLAAFGNRLAGNSTALARQMLSSPEAGDDTFASYYDGLLRRRASAAELLSYSPLGTDGAETGLAEIASSAEYFGLRA